MYFAKLSFAVTVFFCFVLNSTSFALQFTPTSECVFAIITQKRGLASALAHNHFITHKFDRVVIEADPAKPLQAKFISEFSVKELSFDDFDQVEKWLPTIKEIEGLSAQFVKISEGDRNEIKKSALAENQLNADKYPTGKIELKSLSEASLAGFERFKHTAIAEMTIAGKTSEIQMALNFSLEGPNLMFEGISKTTFSKFGITPYSAFLGAVGNKDQFFVYTNCKAIQLSK